MRLIMLSVFWQVCLSDIKEETGTNSCFLFVGRFAFLISKRRQAPSHAFFGGRCACLISGKRQAPIHAFCCWQVCLSDIREETGAYSCILFVGRCACLISGRRQAPIQAFCLLAGVPV